MMMGRAHAQPGAGGGMEIMLLLSGKEKKGGRISGGHNAREMRWMACFGWMGRQEEDTGKAEEEVIVILDAPTLSCQLYDIGCIGA